MPRRLSELEVLALAKVVDKKRLEAARDRVAPGEYAVDAKVDLRVVLRVGRDQDDAANAMRACPWTILQNVLNVLREDDRDADAVLERAMRAIRANRKPVLDDLQARVRRLWRRLLSATRRPRRGAVTVREARVNGSRWKRKGGGRCR